jgi:hypothetical protein
MPFKCYAENIYIYQKYEGGGSTYSLGMVMNFYEGKRIE